jgi:restriction endonuclease
MSFNLSSTDVLDDSGRLIAENDGSPVRSCVLEPTELVQRSKQWRPSAYQELFIAAFNELRTDSENPDRVLTNKLRERIKNKLPEKNNDQFKAIWRDLKESKLIDQYAIGQAVVIDRTDLTGVGG